MPDPYDFLSEPFLPKALSANSILEFNPEHGKLLKDPSVKRAANKIIIPDDCPEWYKIAQKEYISGVKAIANASHNKRILEYLKTTTNLPEEDRNKDETAWCSAFVNWVMKKSNCVGTNSARARSWEDWGKSSEPEIGCIVVFQRYNKDDKGAGHVGFCSHINNIKKLRMNNIKKLGSGEVYILGGNQHKKISHIKFRFITGNRQVDENNRYKLLSYRKP